MALEFLGTPQVANFKSGFVLTTYFTRGIDQNIIWLEVSVSDASTVQVSQPFEKLIH